MKPSEAVGPRFKKRYLICNAHGAYVCDLHKNNPVYTGSAVEALKTGHSWADLDTALEKLYLLRWDTPHERFQLAEVRFAYDSDLTPSVQSASMCPSF